MARRNEQPMSNEQAAATLVQTMEKKPGKIAKRLKKFVKLSLRSRWNIHKYNKLTDEGHTGVAYGNHRSNLDGGALGIVTSKFHQEVILLTATSLDTGGQGKVIQELFQSSQKLNKMLGIKKVDLVITQGDRNRGVEGSNIGPLKSLSHLPDNKDSEGVKDPLGIAIFPEASVEASRLGDDGKPKGMRQFLDNIGGAVFGLPSAWYRFNKENKISHNAVFLPVAIKGTEIFFPPDSKNPPIIGLLVGKQRIKPKAKIKVGKPFTYEQLAKRLGRDPKKMAEQYFISPTKVKEALRQEALDMLAGDVAILLPKKDRGHYKNYKRPRVLFKKRKKATDLKHV